MSPSRGRLRTMLAPPLGALLLFWGCAKQGEGERCDSNGSNDEDCESGLVCVSSEDLLDGDADRCCPPDGTPSDDRCIRSIGGIGGSGGAAGASGSSGSSGSAGLAGGGGQSGSAGEAGSDDGGTPCTYSSQCPGTLVCGPTGVCQPECLNNKDCLLPLTCDIPTQTCVAASVDASVDS